METPGTQNILLINEQTFARLYRDYWKKVFGVCYHVLSDVEVSKEIAQDIFENIWVKRDTLRIKGNPDAYLTKAAKFESFDYLRKRNVRKKHQAHELSLGIDSVNSTEETVLQNELLARFKSILGLLPTKSRQIFEMDNQGVSRAEIAEKMKLSEKSVEYHLYKSIGFLKEKLNYSL
ncbi:RNA polymerase sigma-70 factor (ECF subfamily) [Algoriphagus sp. 4150]|uniref:RNA polymerase sigma factor n=1 Tax=Algoriphagus sp. 4150 TaxID=2817756 RepID=UPI00285FC565|nr:sigma-70 family RNA polymerase sigma factor [Algoriphagus sp. 4150]MDR7129552.1 RNA polymerase sigma-70 factor (ECF subfamily) [Algoriphagus sp. 4150]